MRMGHDFWIFKRRSHWIKLPDYSTTRDLTLLGCHRQCQEIWLRKRLLISLSIQHLDTYQVPSKMVGDLTCYSKIGALFISKTESTTLYLLIAKVLFLKFAGFLTHSFELKIKQKTLLISHWKGFNQSETRNKRNPEWKIMPYFFRAF